MFTNAHLSRNNMAKLYSYFRFSDTIYSTYVEHNDRCGKMRPTLKIANHIYYTVRILLMLWPLDFLFSLFFLLCSFIDSFFFSVLSLSLGPFRLIHTVKNEAMFCFIFRFDILFIRLFVIFLFSP